MFWRKATAEETAPAYWAHKQNRLSEKEVRENQAEETHAALERSALNAEAEALLKKEELFSKAKEEYERDLAGFSFECKRWGDFLTIFIARKGNPTEPKDHFFGVEKPEQSYSTSINLKNVDLIQLKEGYAPDQCGQLSYGYWLPSNENDGCGTLGGTCFGNYAAPDGYHWEARANLPYIPYSRPLFRMETPPRESEGMVIDCSRDNYRIKYKTPNYTRAAEDDRIFFERINAYLFAPAGKGKEVYQMILSARDESPKDLPTKGS